MMSALAVMLIGVAGEPVICCATITPLRPSLDPGTVPVRRASPSRTMLMGPPPPDAEIAEPVERMLPVSVTWMAVEPEGPPPDADECVTIARGALPDTLTVPAAVAHVHGDITAAEDAGSDG